MTKPEDVGGTTESDAANAASSQSSETVPPFTFNRDVADKPPVEYPEKLFSLFAQALFSAPPGDKPNSAAAAQGLAGAGSATPDRPLLTALVVGFSEQELNALGPTLRTLKFNTLVTSNADEAREVLATTPIALLVIDWDLPATHALGLAQMVRKMPVESPFILGLATQLTETLKGSARGTGFDRFYEKPLSRDMLIDCLQGKSGAPRESDRPA